MYKVVWYISRCYITNTFKNHNYTLLSCSSAYTSYDSCERPVNNPHQVTAFEMAAFWRQHHDMFAVHACQFDEVKHFVVGNDDGRILACLFLNRFCLVCVVFEPFGSNGRLFHELMGFLTSHSCKNNIGKQRLMYEFSLPIYLFDNIMHRQICLNVCSLKNPKGFLCSSISSTQYEPLFLFFMDTIRGHPCMGVRCMIALNFGGGAGGKSSTGGIFTASSGVSIRQCWRMLLRFFVHNLRIHLITNHCCRFVNKKVRNKDTDIF